MEARVHPPNFGVHQETVTPENINSLLRKYRVPKDLSVLSIDVDGQDIWIWKAIKVRPEVLIIEYNPIHGPSESVAVPRDPNFRWDGTNYYGASLGAVDKIGKDKGYLLVYANQVNAIFVLDRLIANKSDFRYDEIYRRAPHHPPHAPDPLQRSYISI